MANYGSLTLFLPLNLAFLLNFITNNPLTLKILWLKSFIFCISKSTITFNYLFISRFYFGSLGKCLIMI